MASRTTKTRKTRRSGKKRGPVGRLWDYVGVGVEATENVPLIGGILGALIKLTFVLLFFAFVVGLITGFVVIGLYLQELIVPGAR